MKIERKKNKIREIKEGLRSESEIIRNLKEEIEELNKYKPTHNYFYYPNDEPTPLTQSLDDFRYKKKNMFSNMIIS